MRARANHFLNECVQPIVEAGYAKAVLFVVRMDSSQASDSKHPMSTTQSWKSDDELFAIVQRELFTCVVGDVMDKLDLQHQFLPPQIQPLRADMVVVGRALPVLAVDVFAEKVAGN